MAMIKAERGELLRPLQRVAGVVPNKPALAMVANVLIRQEGAEVTLLTSDIEMQVETKATIGAGRENTTTATSARKLVELVRALPDGDVVIEAGKQLQVKAGKSRFKLQAVPAAEFPIMSEDKPTATFTVPAGKLRARLKQIEVTMAVSDLRYYLNGMLFVLAGNELTLVATDGHRLSLTRLETQDAKGKARHVVPRKVISELGKLLPDDDDELVQVGFADAQVSFRFGSTRLVSKVIVGAYPDYDRVVPQSDRMTNRMVVKREDLSRSLMRAAILAGEKLRVVEVSLGDGSAKLAVANQDAENAEETVDGEYDGAPLTIGFNIDYVIDAVGSVGDAAVTLRFNDALSSALMTVESDPTYRHVLMPTRL